MNKIVNKQRYDREMNQFIIQQVIIFFLLIASFMWIDKKFLSSISILLIAFCVASFYHLYKVYKKIESYILLEVEASAYEKQQQMQANHLKAVKKEQTLLLKYRDEIVNEMDRTQINATNEDEARTKAMELLAKHSEMFNTEFCQHKIIDAILYHKLLLAKSLQIKIKSQLLIPEKLPLKDIDIMFVFTNLLDNAIEACEELLPQERYIEIEGMKKANYLCVRVTNSKDENIRLDAKHIATSKVDKKEHGLGLQIIRLVCKQNQGKLKIVDHGKYVDMFITLALDSTKRV